MLESLENKKALMCNLLEILNNYLLPNALREVGEECRSQKVLSVGQYFIKHISLMFINSNYLSKH